MAAKMTTSDAGRALIKRYEGLATRVYMDTGVPAIGYGHRILGDVPKAWVAGGITEGDADALLTSDLSRVFEPMVNARVPDGCQQWEFDALVSFCYNVQGQPKSLEDLLTHGWGEVANQLPRWCNVNHQPNDGLRARRMAEAAMFRGEAGDGSTST